MLYDSYSQISDLTDLTQIFTTADLLNGTSILGPLADGIHDLKLEVEDRAGNISQDFLLDVTIDTVAPPVSILAIDPAATDTGIEGQPATFVDRITADTATGFVGRAEADAIVRLYVDPASDDAVGNPAEYSLTVAVPEDGNLAFPDGQWNTAFIRDLNDPGFFPLDGIREVAATAEDLAGNVSEPDFLDMFIDTQGPQVDDVSITGHAAYDLFDPKPSEDSPTPLVDALDVTFIDDPIREHGFGTEHNRGWDVTFEGAFENNLGATIGGVTNSDDATAAVALSFPFAFGDQDPTTTVFVSSNGFISIGGNNGSDCCNGDPNELVNDPFPRVAGLWDDLNPSEAGDVYFNDFGDRAVFTWDNVETWGSSSDVTFQIQLHVNGDITVVYDQITTNDTSHDFLVGLSPGGGVPNPGETDLSTAIPLQTSEETVYELFTDLQAQFDLDFTSINYSPKPYPAVNEILATTPGNYQLVGDANGIIPIQSIEFIDQTTAGDIGRTIIRLNFFEALPDDRFTLTVFDRITDDAGNALDGESNAAEPQETPTFPTGDGVPGGDFVARFTVDSRPELGCWAAGSVYVDTNGNFSFDPENVDFTNRDIVYTLGFTSDDVFAGNFALNPGDTADGFDKLAAYGRVGSSYRWLVDTDNDGVPNVVVSDPANINGLPVAGEFDGDPNNGDEVGVFTGTTWWLDTDHDFNVDTAVPALPATSDLTGYPVVGDFNGDGADDLATWSDDTFYLDLNFDGLEDTRFTFGMIGVRERPVAADMDQDGIDDLGLWVPDRSGAVPEENSEWYFLVSDGRSILDRIVPDPWNPAQNVVNFTPVPFGADMYARFGDEFAIPVVGNFDPPVAGGDAAGRSDPGIVHLNGTAGADEFDFRPGAKPGSWLVTLNGDQQYIAAASVTVTFNGRGGNDIATITGTDGNERAVFDIGSARLTQPGVLALSVTNVERISIDGGGGSDTAILRDSIHDDHFDASPRSGKLTYNSDPQRYAEALNFGSIVAVARYGGDDTADLHGSDGNDIFVGRTGWSTLRDRDPSGGDYRLSAKFFETTTAHAGDGTDQAFLHDSNRDDHFEGTADYGRLEFGDAPNHAVQANGFSFVVAYARAGGTDTGNLVGSDGNEKFVGRQTWSKLRSQDPSAEGAYSHLLKFFETVTATAGNGGTDFAWLFGSPGNDTLVATPASTTLSGWRFSNTVQGFPNVGARGGGGNDEAYLSADGHDHLLAQGKLAQLTWDDTWVLSAYGFDYVEADGNEGENNTREKILPIDYVLAATDDWDLL